MFSLPPGANFSLAARRRVSETSQTATISVFSALAARPEAGDANTLVGAEDTAVGGGRPGGGGGQKITTLHHGCTPAGALPVSPIGHMLALVAYRGVRCSRGAKGLPGNNLFNLRRPLPYLTVAAPMRCQSRATVRELSRYAGRYGERGDLRCGGRDRQSGWDGVGAARRALPRGGPFAGEAGAGVRQDGARGDLSGRFERGAPGGRGGARGGHHHLLRGAAVPRAPSASRADADHGGGGEAGRGRAAGATVERL